MKQVPRRIVVFAPNWLGDAVMALPAIADVKRRLPDAHLVVAARPAVAGIFHMAPPVDEVLTLAWKGRRNERDGWDADIAALRQAACDTALLLPNSFASAWTAWRAGIRQRWGYARDMRRLLLTRAVAVRRRSVHQSEYYQHLVRSLGFPTGPAEPVLEVPADADAAALGLLLARGWDGVRPLVVIAPGAAYGTAKQWIPESFSRLSAMLTAARDTQCVLVGSAADAEVTAAIRAAAGAAAARPVIDLAGATSLATLAAVLRRAAVCVSNDSGAMHLAGAVGASIAALFGPTREQETAPLTRRGRRAEVLFEPVECRPCMLRECPIDHRCMTRLSPERVFDAVSGLMAGAADLPGQPPRPR
jgi:heptosyltransferase-2